MNWIILERNHNYAVNKKGEIFSFRRNHKLTPKVNHDGYLRIQLYYKGKCEFVSIHRLIAETFIANPENKAVVNHIDGNKQNNAVDNLEWCTQSENIRHAYDTGLAHQPLNIRGKTVQQFTKEGDFIQEFPSTMEVERTLGIYHAHISSAIKRNGTAGGFRWKEVLA